MTGVQTCALPIFVAIFILGILGTALFYVIDWIEQIPFGETRNYVQRVLENVQVYRARLAGREAPLKILEDLYAPNAPAMPVLTAAGK